MAKTDAVLRRWFWPTMDSAETAKSYLTIGAITLVVYGAINLVVYGVAAGAIPHGPRAEQMIQASISTTPLALTLATLALVLLWDLTLAIFLYRGSRVAAVVNLAMQIGNVAMVGPGRGLDLLGTVIFVIFVNAVWAAFAYQRLLHAR